MDSSNLVTLPVAVFGYGTLLFDADYFVGGARPNTEILYLVIALGAPLFVCFVLAPRGFRLFEQNLDLLVPYGSVQAVSFLLLAGLGQPMAWRFTRPFVNVELWGFCALLASVFLHVVYILWLTMLCTDVARGQRCRLVAPWERLRELLPRGIALIALGYAGLLFLILLVAVSSLVMFVFPIYAVLFSFVSLLWIPLALYSRKPLLSAIEDATRNAVRHKGEWALLIFGWMLALGFLYVFQYTVTTSTASSTSTTSSTLWGASFDWVGAFPDDSRWYDELCGSARITPEGLWNVPLQLLCPVMAVSVKLELFRKHTELGLLPARAPETVSEFDAPAHSPSD